MRFLLPLLFVTLALEAQTPSRFEKKPSVPDSADAPSTPSANVEEPKPKPVVEPAQKPEPGVQKTPSESNSRSRFDPTRMTYGGWLSLQFGSYTAVALSPRVGYWFTDRLNAGVGFTYFYLKDQRVRPTYEQSVYGFSPFASYNIIGPIAISAEYEMLNTDVLIVNPVSYEYTVQREWVPGLYLGLSYMPQEGGAFFQILYNVLYNSQRSLFANPVIRFGASF
ncbi:hypothetical protein GC167_06555 [bacterium]|nr:hypothetical protein [bacterium]